MSNINIPIFYYHSVAPPKNPKWFKHYLTLNLKYFEDFLKFLKYSGYNTLFLDEYFYSLESSAYHKKKLICLTFDDGYIDNWIYVFPLLKKYKLKATIFVSPEFVDMKEKKRFTLIDYWENRCSYKELNRRGFLSYDEMYIMIDSGIIDIQSHTLTHNKYPCSDRIIGFHHPGSDCLSTIGPIHPEKKPYYIEDLKFERLIPYGYPFFEEKSSLIVEKVTINHDFITEIINRLKKIDWLTYKYSFDEVLSKVKDIYNAYKNEDRLILSIESDRDYKIRVAEELLNSKLILEKRLDKKVNYCCWPNGDYSDYTHKKAREFGYNASTVVLRRNQICPKDRFDRIGVSSVSSSRSLSLMKSIYKLNSYREVFGFKNIRDLYYSYKY